MDKVLFPSYLLLCNKYCIIFQSFTIPKINIKIPPTAHPQAALNTGLKPKKTAEQTHAAAAIIKTIKNLTVKYFTGF
jgi:hypothetical protein